MENISNKQAKDILRNNPHKWIYNRFGQDLICGVCDSNMEGMECEAVRTSAENLSKKYQKKLAKQIKKYGTSPWDFDAQGFVNVPKSLFKTKENYNYPEDAKIIKCPCCQQLRQVYAYSEYKPVWIRIREFFDTVKRNLKPVIIKNKICKKFGWCGWDKKTHKMMWPFIFANNKVETNYNTEHPLGSAEVLIYGYDKALSKNIYLVGYYRADTDKFYMAKDCLKKNDLVSFWKINIENWAVLRYIDIDEFEDRG